MRNGILRQSNVNKVDAQILFPEGIFEFYIYLKLLISQKWVRSL